ncbi:MAG: TerD family protein [Clostridia bacterium]|nr:TerD family protein [Clostridia bacterium]
MPVNLKKGQKISLTKGEPGLKNIIVGIGWEVPTFGIGSALDLDASVFLLTAANKVSNSKDFIFYGNLVHPSNSVQHLNVKSVKWKDDKEKIKIDLSLVPSWVVKIAFTATIYEGESKKQGFSQVKNAYIRICNEQTNEEIVRYDLAEKLSNETAVLFGEIYKNNGEWKFNAMGVGSRGGLASLCGLYGVEVG